MVGNVQNVITPSTMRMLE